MNRKSFLASVGACFFLAFILLQAPSLVSSTAEKDALDKQWSERSESTSPSPWSVKRQETIEGWIEQIASKDASFANWQGASFDVQPVGPGLQEWIVIVTQKKQEVGYLIIAMDQNEEFVLIEYGKGLEQIWGASGHHQDLALQEFGPRFSIVYSGLFIGATDENQSGLYNYVTGENYEHVQLAELQPYWHGEKVEKLQQSVRSASLSADPIVFYGEQYEEADSFEAAHSYMFVAKLIPRVTALYEVYGWHQWTEGTFSSMDEQSLYIGLVDEGLRYFSSSYLKKIGVFNQIQ